MNPEVDTILSKSKKWHEELAVLRAIVLDCGLTEEVKWKQPCYTFNKRNIAIIHGFKEYCALLFFNGALLNDANGILIQQTENVQAGRQIRFTNLAQIVELKAVLKAYIFEAIEVEKAGLKVALKPHAEYTMPEELAIALAKNTTLKTAFEALTPGRQRAYILHFSVPVQPKTRESRIENCTPKILSGKGLTDCTCGLSKRMPNCDGSHKQLR